MLVGKFIRAAATVAAVLCFMMSANSIYAASASADARALQIYFIDVEGGQSTLFVTPAGQSLLIDAGWPDNNNRDASRILAATKLAGIDHLDYVLITHFHEDHVGGVPQLAAKIHIGTFIDHGVNRETSDAATEQGYLAYKKLLAAGHYGRILAKPGMVLPIKGLHGVIVSADGELLQQPLPGAGQPNRYCKAPEQRPLDQTENARSVGTFFTFGKFKFVDLGDLTWDKEMKLMCPVNKLGTVDLYIVSHHGWFHSSSPAFVDAIHPRVAIMDNGATKGGSSSTLDIIRKAPGLEALWQLHYSEEGGKAHNTAMEYIANVQGGSDGNYIKVTAQTDGSFNVYNSRTNETKHYAAR